MWAIRGEEMLAKCAEALALRMIAPEELGGLYLEEEFQHAIIESETTPEPTRTADTATPLAVPQPTVAPAVNQAPAAREPFQTLVPNTNPDPATETRMFKQDEVPQVFSVPPAPVVAAAPRSGPPKPPAPPKPATAAGPGAPVIANRLPIVEQPTHETMAELNAVADAVARDKDPVAVPHGAGAVPQVVTAVFQTLRAL